MIITVLWEDQLGGQAKAFGPHELLIACLEDRTGQTKTALKRLVVSVPLKGNGNVRRALQRNLGKLVQNGPVVSVLDRDKAQDLWSPKAPNCFGGLRSALRQDAPGEYDVVFLVDNIESIVAACCHSLGEPVPTTKPAPNHRDRIIGKVVWGPLSTRQGVCNAVPSFERLVQRVADRLGASAL